MANIFSKNIEEILELEVNMLYRLQKNGVRTLHNLLTRTREELKKMGLSKINLTLLEQELSQYYCQIGMFSKDSPVQ